MKCIVYISTALSLLLVLTGGIASAEVPDFNRDVRPILAENCFACHGADASSREADLRLDVAENAYEWAIVPGDPNSSEVVARVFSNDPDLVMPPPESKKSLTTEEKKLLRDWVTNGAEYQPHWALIAPVQSKLPVVNDREWPKNEIDHFTLAKLEEFGLKPAPEADPHVLFRRLHLDITGLPPSLENVENFVDQYHRDSEEAMSQWIDKLMQSSAWGEHRGRYWLDAARYGDTHGMHFDNYREMWVYRDWVIKAFNKNQPFDEFTVEQLAGDLLDDPTDEQLIATGFQRCNITTNEGGTIKEENLANYASDRVQTFGWVFLGLTTNCCQCHDHKFDPISMKDYYSLAAFFRNTTQQSHDGNLKDGKGPILVVPSDEDRARLDILEEELAEVNDKIMLRTKEAEPKFEEWLATASPEQLVASLPTESLAFHIPLDEGQGNEVRATVGSDTKFTAVGSIDWLEEGYSGSSPILAKDAYFELGDQGDFDLDQPFSYGAWVRTVQGEFGSAIISRMDEKHKHRGWDLWQQSIFHAVHLIDTWPNNAIKVSTQKPTYSPKRWQHLFVTYDGSAEASGIRIYVNGRRVAVNIERDTLKPGATIRNSTELRVGRRAQGAAFEGGSVQDVRIYNRELKDYEIKYLAELSSLKSILAAKPGERTKEQLESLRVHYLKNYDDEYQRVSAAKANLAHEIDAIRTRSPITHIQQENADSPAKAHMLMRGAYDAPGEEVTAATPAALHALPNDAPPNRLGLAKWVIDPANPLTTRVTVNRFWQEVFGLGFVATPEDFGVMGSPPTHPALLDWLAVDFRESGWDVKKLFKSIFMSATYRQAAIVTPDKREVDRGNYLLSRGPRFRMDAEMVRDYALATSGLLSRKMFGPGTHPYQPVGIWDIVGLPGGNTRDYLVDSGENLYRRSVYNFWKRMAPPPSLEALNAPSREVCTVRRERTNTPLQALVTLNDVQFVEAARKLAEEAMQSQQGDEANLARSVSERVLCRPISDVETDIILANCREFRQHYRSNPNDAVALLGVGDSEYDKTLEEVELATWTMVCNQLMNLDEALSK